MDEITQEVKEGCVKELLCDDDLVLLGDSWEKVELRYTQWLKANNYAEKGVNVKKRKVFCTCKRTVAMEAAKFSCSVSRRGVQRLYFMHQM